MNIYTLTGELFSFVRCFYPKTYTLPDVLKRTVEYMKSGGYQVSVLDDSHRDYKVISVDDHSFRIVRYKNSPWYEVEAIN